MATMGITLLRALITPITTLLAKFLEPNRRPRHEVATVPRAKTSGGRDECHSEGDRY